jgi:hypothetical protein
MASSLRIVRAVLTRPPAWQRHISLERYFATATSFPRSTKDGRSSLPSPPGRQRVADFVASLPVRKSGSERNEQPTVSVVRSPTIDDGDGLDDRSNAKMAALAKAKEKMRTICNDDVTSNDEKRIQTGRELAHAYSQAIKYTSRMTKNVTATRLAEETLYEWMDEVMRPFGVTTSGRMAKINDDAVDDDVSNTAIYLTKKWTIRTANEIARRLGGENTTTSPNVISVQIPPPSSSDYINLLRAYSSSKARRKGQQCEVLIKNMMTLADVVSCHCYTTTGDDETTGEAMEEWKLWVKEGIPNSKAFALAIKCHAGSTRPDSFERIILLNHIHDAFADCYRPYVAGIYKDDPYVLFHSIKALKNLQKKEEYNLGKEWLGSLHKFVTTAENDDYFGVVDLEKGDTEDLDHTEDAVVIPSLATTIDVTPAYTTMIRLMARLRGKIGVAEDARTVLDRMHEIKAYNSDVNSLRKRIATIDIRANSYNLILGLYKDSKNAEHTTKAIELLERMVDAGRKTLEDRDGVPLPTEVSFEYTIMAIANLTDSEKALDEAERLIKLMEEQEYIESSVAAYNAYIIVSHRQLYGKPQLYDTALDILDKMNEMGKINSVMLPSSDTLALVMKSCALSEHSDHKKVLNTATTLFLQMKEKETLSDRAYYYMMKCVDMYSNKDSEAKKEHIQELFSEACQRGLCSANVLSCFRSCVSDEDYRLTVGHGRLADHWIANITSPRALYTDGSKGGAGRNARRKGKSTSDWVKKTKAKEVERETRKSDKQAKKSFKKIINSSR